LLAGAAVYLTSHYGQATDAGWAILAAGLLAAAGLAGAYMLLRRDDPRPALVNALALGLLGHAALLAGLAPRLDPLWLSRRTETAMAKAQLLPRQGIADAPVTVAGYAEPSLVFALGTETELGGADDAAEAIAEHRPAVVEARQEPAFRRALAADHATALAVAEVKGVDYSDGHRMTLRIYKAPDTAAAAVAAPGGQP
jgi:hypothetical protein